MAMTGNRKCPPQMTILRRGEGFRFTGEGSGEERRKKNKKRVLCEKQSYGRAHLPKGCPFKGWCRTETSAKKGSRKGDMDLKADGTGAAEET